MSNYREHLDTALRLIVESTRDIVACDAIVLYVYDQKSCTFYPPWLLGLRQPDMASAHQPTPDSLISRVFRRAEIHISERVAKDPLLRDSNFVAREHIQLSLLIPLKTASQLVGVLFANYRTHHAFKPSEVDSIKRFAELAAIAIVNAQLLAAAANTSLLQSLFLSYSSKDEAFARRLFSKLTDAGVRVWFAATCATHGEKLYKEIDDAIRGHDRLLVVLSEHSLQSPWVKTEILKAHKAQLQDGHRRLFPIRLVNMAPIKQWTCFDADSGTDVATEIREYFIPNFSGWRNGQAFKVGMNQLLKGLAIK